MRRSADVGRYGASPWAFSACACSAAACRVCGSPSCAATLTAASMMNTVDVPKSRARIPPILLRAWAPHGASVGPRPRLSQGGYHRGLAGWSDEQTTVGQAVSEDCGLRCACGAYCTRINRLSIFAHLADAAYFESVFLANIA